MAARKLATRAKRGKQDRIKTYPGDLWEEELLPPEAYSPGREVQTHPVRGLGFRGTFSMMVLATNDVLVASVEEVYCGGARPQKNMLPCLVSPWQCS